MTPTNPIGPRLQSVRTATLALCTALALTATGCGGGAAGGASTVPAEADRTPDAGTANAAAGTADDAMPPAEAAAKSIQSAAEAPNASEDLASADAAAEAAEQQAQALLRVEAEIEEPAEKVISSFTAGTAQTTLLPTTDAESGVVAGTLVVRARGTVAGGQWPQMVVRVNGQVIGSTTVTSTQLVDRSFSLPVLPSGAVVDVVFTNDAVVGAEDRNLFVAYLRYGNQVIMPTTTNAFFDRGVGNAAFDRLDTLPGSGNLFWGGALRLTWPAGTPVSDALRARQRDTVRFLQQASFGPTLAEVNALTAKPYSTWIDEQIALPVQADYVNAVQAQYNLGDAWRPKGANYTPAVVGQTFWKTAVTAPDQLRKRVAFALHQVFMVSQADSNLWHQARTVAAYHDLLNKNAFGNYRRLMEDMALSPAMGLYLSHMRNRKEDAVTGRLPDENFARELMQLFSIGLHELNADGSLKRDALGNPIETYTNADVMALAQVFTGWVWAFPDTAMTEANFRWGWPVTTASGDQRIDTLPMKAHAPQHSTAAKALFVGKPWALRIPAGGSAQTDLKLALDTLFKHPNVGPFIGRQLIQHLVTSQPSPAYVARVTAVFNNNGNGVRGDLAAVVRAILLDTEARNPPPPGFGKLREPVLRVAHWARALGARSVSGNWAMANELETAGQRALAAPSVFGYFRPGYVPPGTSFAATNSTAPQFQITSESTVAAWINTAEAMAGNGLGWNGSGSDVRVDHAALGRLTANGSLDALADHLNLVLLGGRMPSGMRRSVLDAMAAATGSTGADAVANRARAATFLVMASPDYVSQP